MSKNTRSLKEKIVTVNILFFSGVLTVLFALFFTYWYTAEQKKTAADLETIAQTKADQFFSKLWNMDRTALHLASDPFISTELLTDPALTRSPENYFTENKILSNSTIQQLMPFALNKQVTSRICLFNNSNDFLFVGESLSYDKTVNYAASPEFLQVREQFAQGQYRVILPPRDDPFHYESRLTRQTTLVSVFREIIDYSNAAYQSVGYVEVQQVTGVFRDMFADLQETMTYAVTDREGKLFLGNDAAENGRLWNRAQEHSIANDQFDMVLTLKQNNAYLTRMSATLGLVLFLTLLFMVFGILSTENFVIQRLTTPLDELQQMVDSVNVRNLDFGLTTDSEYDQIQHLNMAFTGMMKKLKNSVDELVEARTDELRSHLFALQAQINPHFIHNTMTVISSIAEEHGVLDIEDICTKLSSMIRYSSQYDNTGAALEDELAHALNYLDLMQIRYQDRVSFRVSRREGAGEIQVPKFLLQPLIENSFSHGLKTTPPPWEINLTVDLSENHWSAAVEDNGSGFSPEILREIDRLWNSISLDKTEEILRSLEIGGMGLQNVFARLYLKYRERMVFHMENTPQGARIVVGGTR